MRDLIEEVSEWARDFICNFDEEAGWATESARQAHLAEGPKLQADLQRALGESHRVELDDLGSGKGQSHEDELPCAF